MVGSSLGHYRILTTLGIGGMGEVYAANDTQLKRQVALKILPPALASDPERRERFKREAQAVASLNHPGIVTIYSVELSGDVPFLTMELIDGSSLDKSISRDGVALARLLPIAIPLADAIAAAHERGVVHRDLKPSNVMLTEDGRVKVLDFGLAKLKEVPGSSDLNRTRTQTLTETGSILGTVAYMSPEQAECKPVDARTDIFSLGVILYEMAVGERPFKGDTNLSILSSILRDTPPPITDRNAALPHELERMVRRCLAKDPRNRYQSAADLRNDLEELKQSLDSGARNSTGPMAMSRTPPRPGKKTRFAAVGAVLMVAAFTIGYLVWARGRSTPVPTTTDAAPAAAASSGRIFVTAFANRTGDQSLDSLGTLVAERWIEELTKEQIGEPVPRVIAASEVRGLPADLVITGAFDRHGSALTFQTRVMGGSDGKLLYASQPASVPTGDAERAIMPLHQDVKTAVFMQLLGTLGLFSKVPSWEATREYRSALELLGIDGARALGHFQRALQIEPQFVFPRIFIVSTLQSAGRWDQAVAALAPLIEARQRLSPFERCLVDYMAALEKGQTAEALVSALDARNLAPADYATNYSLGTTQLRLNRPAQALATFATLREPELITRFGAAGWRWGAASTARHLLGDFATELREVKEAQRVAPHDILYRGAEARALIGLGNTKEALRVVDELLAMPGSPGPAMLTVALELRAHGSRPASLDVAARAIDWYRSRPPNVTGSEENQAGLARALIAAEKWDEAKRVAEVLVGKSPHSPEYSGMLGAIAARDGNQTDVSRWSNVLRGLSQPHLFGSHVLWRARIAALRGDQAVAVALLREAIAQGPPATTFWLEMHRDMNLEPLKDNAAFRDTVRPKE